MFIQRIIALLMLIIPALIAMVGWNMMKNVIIFGSESYVKFIIGLLLFLGGVTFVGGFVFHRDKKRKLLQPRFLRKKKKN